MSLLKTPRLSKPQVNTSYIPASWKALYFFCNLWAQHGKIFPEQMPMKHRRKFGVKTLSPQQLHHPNQYKPAGDWKCCLVTKKSTQNHKWMFVTHLVYNTKLKLCSRDLPLTCTYPPFLQTPHQNHAHQTHTIRSGLHKRQPFRGMKYTIYNDGPAR